MALSRKVLNGQARLIAYNVMQFMKKEAEDGLQIDRKAAQKRTAAATGIKLTTLRRIVREGKITDSVFRTPGKKRPRQNTVSGLDAKSHAVLKRTIHNFHKTENELPSIYRLVKKLKEQNVFAGSRTSLRNLLKKLGFQWKKSKTNRRKLLIESSKVRLKRVEYLQAIANYRAEGRPIVYTDEFFILSPQSFPPSAISSVHKIQGFQMLLAGSEDDIIPNTLLMLEANSKADLITEKLSHEEYENWVRLSLMPNLPPYSVVVVDDAAYHNKYEDEAPGSIAKRSEMEAWLQEKGINFGSTMLKPQLYSLISVYKEKFKNYNLDRILCENNHTVLRLPPHHPEFNPMAMAWDEVRAYIATADAVDDSKWAQSATTLVKDKLNKMKEFEWKTLCLEVHKIEEEFMRNDLKIDRLTEDISIEETGGWSGSEEGSSEHDDSDGSDGDDDDDDNTSDFVPSSTLQPSTAFVAKDKVPSLKQNQVDNRIRDIVNNTYKYFDFICFRKNHKFIYLGKGGRSQIIEQVAEATGIGMPTILELLDFNDDTDDTLSKKNGTERNKTNNPKNSENFNDFESTENDALGTKTKVPQRAEFKNPRVSSHIVPAQKNATKIGNIVMCNLQNPKISENKSKGPPVVITKMKRPKPVEVMENPKKPKTVNPDDIKQEIVDCKNDVKLEVVEVSCEFQLPKIKTEINEDIINSDLETSKVPSP